MFDHDGNLCSTYTLLKERLEKLGGERLTLFQHATDRTPLSLGMTFNVYSDIFGVERILPLDIILRIISASDWNFLDRRLQQRIQVLNLFVNDIYNEQKILKNKIIPAELVLSSAAYCKPCVGFTPR